MSNDPDQSGDEPGPLNSFEKMVFSAPAPASPQLAKLVEQYVGRAKLKFRDFRVDRENIEHALVKAARNGDLSQEDAAKIFLDAGDMVSLPLAQRYIEMREFELMAKYLRTRLHYHGQSRLTARNRLMLDGMISGGEPAMAAALLRKYLAKVREHAQNRWRGAAAKPHKELPIELRPQFEEQKARELRDLPAHLEIAELELAEIEIYIAAHGSREDNRAIEKFREEIAKVRKRFNLA
ncbi:MAG: hypothetical protein EP341_10465 [Sphingomonadales bacterium]|nr:MAG: hypothetical protein EP341_10465 [Sphingomonadales bacterium]